MDDRTLLAEYCRTKSNDAFATLVKRYIDLVYSAARRQVGDPGLAEDVTQAVFLLLSQKAPSLRPDVVLSAWLLSATHLCSLDAIKRRARRLKHETRAAEMSDSTQRENNAARWNELSPVIDKAMASLPRRYREVLAMRFWEGKSHREIGESIGISENATAKRMTRALEKLRLKLVRSKAVSASDIPTQSLGAMLISANIIQTAPEHLINAAISATQSAAPMTVAIAKGATYMMTISQLKVAAIGAVAVLAIVGIAIPVTTMSLAQRAQPAPANAPAPAVARQILPVVPPTTQRFENAADSYAKAISYHQNLQRGPLNDAYNRAVNRQFDDRTEAMFAGSGPILAYIRQGATTPMIDWGTPTVAQRIERLGQLRGLVNMTIAHARYAIIRGDFDAAVDDTLTTMALARHIGANALLTDKLVEVAAEIGAIDTLASTLASLPKEQVLSLRQRLNALPKPVTGREVINGEFTTALRTSVEQGQQVQIDALNSLGDFYAKLGESIDQPPEQFAKVADEQVARLEPGTVPEMFAKILVPSLKRATVTMAMVEAKRIMLLVAVEVLLEGEGVVANSRDPYGVGPFTYAKTPAGFDLSSQLTDPAKPEKPPVTLSVKAGG